jgi:hypothetical protein
MMYYIIALAGLVPSLFPISIKKSHKSLPVALPPPSPASYYAPRPSHKLIIIPEVPGLDA